MSDHHTSCSSDFATPYSEGGGEGEDWTFHDDVGSSGGGGGGG